MPSYVSGDLIREVRKRKRWTQSQVLCNDALTDANLSRVERKKQKPNTESFNKLMETMEMPVENFFCPFLENQTPELLQMRETALYYLSFVHEQPLFAQRMADLLLQMEKTGHFSEGINKQFRLFCKAALLDYHREDQKKNICHSKRSYGYILP